MFQIEIRHEAEENDKESLNFTLEHIKTKSQGKDYVVLKVNVAGNCCLTPIIIIIIIIIIINMV